ncbi:MAG TPA: M13 family metallopeptidase [Kofleriaceae bacterium]|jgi:putative endopeptidase
MRIVLPAILLAAACGSGQPPVTTPAPAPQPTEPAPPAPPPTADEPPAPPAKPVVNKTLASIGLDPDAIDRSADPCEDFYQFACGGWVAKAEIPADKPLNMRSFVAIDDRNIEYEHELLERARTSPGADPILEKLGTYYGSCMDEASIEKAGIKPIKPMLDVIGNVKDAKSLSRAIAVLHSQSFDILFDMGPTQDSADAKSVIAGIDQGGLGLPDRDYYLKDTDDMKQHRADYAHYVAKLLVIAGHKPDKAATEADEIVALETQIAKVSKDKVAMRDPKGTYNKIDRTGVAKAMPDFDWKVFWKTVGLKDVKDVTTSSPEFLAGIDPLLTSTKPEVWRDYLTVHLLGSAAAYLPKQIEDTRFELRKSLTGQAEQEPRWKRCARHTDHALGDLLGQAFVRDKFAGASKSAADEAVHAIVAAMNANLGQLPWMDATTKQKAAAKLSAMAYQIGYPNHWRSYAFSLEPKAWAKNALAADKAENARQLAKIGRPVDRDDWGMTVPTVNAYYNPQLNMMVFPAGILQPPFYSVDATLPVNLGAMGMVVGHELTHGFDDQGSQYDGDGNLKDWWQPETETQFKQRTQCVKDQYSGYEISGVKLNGEHTAGENIADIGGVKLALSALHSLRASAPDTVVADGFTEDQQFFLSFGQVWCSKAKPEYEKMMATVNEHSPGRWRVDGALSATPEFSKAFHCKLGAKMRPAKQCVVW